MQKNHLIGLCLMFISVLPSVGFAQKAPAIRLLSSSADALSLQLPEQGVQVRYLALVHTPNDQVLRKDLEDQRLFRMDQDAFPESLLSDGLYKVQFAPYYSIPDDQRKTLRRLQDEGTTRELQAFRSLWGLPEEAQTFNWTFRVHQGRFLTPDLIEITDDALRSLSYPAVYQYPSIDGLTAALPASSTPLVTSTLTSPPLPMDTYMAPALDGDLTVRFSLCVGGDCANSEVYGFSTIKLKENNLRITFEDTSTGTFPANDWEIFVNEQGNGGLNRYTIRDVSNARNIFTLEAGAPSNALYVENSGDVGFGTMDPVVELHSIDGDTPTLRLEQDGSSGFGEQIWDVAGNESGFFIRDVTNGSALSFRIQPGSPADAFFIKPSAVEIRNDIKIDGSILPISDARIKTDVQDLTGALPLLRKLQPKSYAFRQNGLAEGLNMSTGLQFGLIAQEVQEVFPNLVQEHFMVTDEDGKDVQLYGVNYQGLIPVLLKGMQEQQALIEQQQAELAALRQKADAVDDLYEKLEKLSAQMQSLQNQSSAHSSTNQQ